MRADGSQCEHCGSSETAPSNITTLQTQAAQSVADQGKPDGLACRSHYRCVVPAAEVMDTRAWRTPEEGTKEVMCDPQVTGPEGWCSREASRGTD